MNPRNMQSNNRIIEFENAQQMHFQQQTEPYILLGRAHQILPTSGNVDGTALYRLPQYAHQMHPVTNPEVGIPAPTTFYNPYMVPASGTRMLPSSSNFGPAAAHVSGYGVNGLPPNVFRGSSKRNGAETFMGNTQYFNAMPPMNVGHFDPGVGILDACFPLPEFRGNYVGQSFRPPTSTWCERQPISPYFEVNNIAGPSSETGQMGGQMFHESAASNSRRCTPMLHPLHEFHPPQAVPHYRPLAATSSGRQHPTNNRMQYTVPPVADPGGGLSGRSPPLSSRKPPRLGKSRRDSPLKPLLQQIWKWEEWGLLKTEERRWNSRILLPSLFIFGFPPSSILKLPPCWLLRCTRARPATAVRHCLRLRLRRLTTGNRPPPSPLFWLSNLAPPSNNSWVRHCVPPPPGIRIYRSHRREQTHRHPNLPHLRLLEEGVAILEFSGHYEMSSSTVDHHRDMRLDIDYMSYEELLALSERIGNVKTGLSEDAITAQLKTRVHRSSMASIDLEELPCSDDKNDSCVICQEEYEDNDKIGSLDCGHEYHFKCLQKWLPVKNTCPICKSTALKC